MCPGTAGLGLCRARFDCGCGGPSERSCCEGCGRDMPKPIEGVIFSQPCRACPVKLVILCIVGGGSRRGRVVPSAGRGG